MRGVANRAGAPLTRQGVGPNTNENAFERFDVPDYNRGGLIGVVTQSGHNGRPIVQGNVIGAHFTRWIAGGNYADLEAAHFIQAAEDPATAAIAGYIEGFRNFPAAARQPDLRERA